MIDTTIFIDKILKPTIFANQLIEFLFDKSNKIEITIHSKLQKEDKKALKGKYKKHIILNNYSFPLDFNEYRNIKNRLEKYFSEDWGFIVSDKHRGLLSFKMETFSIDCTDESDKSKKEQFLDSLILSKVINEYELNEDDWVDPYNKK